MEKDVKKDVLERTLNDLSSLSPEELARFTNQLKKWHCEDCQRDYTSWSSTEKTCKYCNSTNLKQIMHVAAVPTTTGIQVDMLYDNIDTIDQQVSHDNGIEEQNKDLEKLEKARR